MIQNKWILGALSFVIVLSSVLFITQPSQAYAQANAQFKRERDGIVVFGAVKLKDGTGLENVKMSVGQERKYKSNNDHEQNQEDQQELNQEQLRQYEDEDRRGERRHHKTRIFDTTRTDSDGNFKLWINSHETHRLRNKKLVIYLKPEGGSTYQQTVELRPGDVASAQITMETPLVPILPFPVFVY